MKLKKREKAIIWTASVVMTLVIVLTIIAAIVFVFSYVYALTNNTIYPLLWLVICIVFIVYLFLRQ